MPHYWPRHGEIEKGTQHKDSKTSALDKGIIFQEKPGVFLWRAALCLKYFCFLQTKRYPWRSVHFMRKSLSILGRPFGPQSQQWWSNQNRNLTPNIGEITLTGMQHYPRQYANMHSLYKSHPRKGALTAIPRDLGEKPRNLVLRMLYTVQPIDMHRLWIHLRNHEFCPLDSKKHLRAVLRICRLMNWVVTQTSYNQTSWMWSVHPSRTREVERMVREAKSTGEELEKSKVTSKENQGVAKKKGKHEQLNTAIRHAQMQLIQNVMLLKERDPSLFEAKNSTSNNSNDESTDQDAANTTIGFSSSATGMKDKQARTPFRKPRVTWNDSIKTATRVHMNNLMTEKGGVNLYWWSKKDREVARRKIVGKKFRQANREKRNPGAVPTTADA